LRLRGGHGLPALIAARFVSRIATICRACDLVSSRRLTSPPRRPISARYSRTFFSVSVILQSCIISGLRSCGNAVAKLKEGSFDRQEKDEAHRVDRQSACGSSLVILPVSSGSILERRILPPGAAFLTAADFIVTSPPSPAREIFEWRARPSLQPGARLRSRF